MSVLSDLLANIRLSRDEIIQVSSARENLMGSLSNKAEEGKIPHTQETFLVGSYIRSTKIRPLDDVDIFYVAGSGIKPSGGTHLLQECTFDFDASFLDNSGHNISSVKVVNLFKRAIQETYSTSEIKRDGEVIRVYLTSYDVGFDITPAFYFADQNYYLMPRGGNSTHWKRTNPKVDANVLNSLQEKHNGLMKDIIKLLKHWFAQKHIKNLRSYHIESLLYYLFNDLPPIDARSEGLLASFHYINRNHNLLECADPTGYSGALSSGLSQQDVDKIVDEAQAAKSKLLSSEAEYVNYVN